MKRLLILLSTLLLASCLHPSEVAVPSRAQTIEQRFDSTGALVFERGGSLLVHCSGVFIGSYFVTAAHCVVNRGGSVVRDSQVSTRSDFNQDSGEFIRSHLFTTSVVWNEGDVAVLAPANAVTRILHSSVQVAQEDLDLGDTVEVYGHPIGYGYYFSNGEVVSVLRVRDSETGIQEFTMINAPGYPGMSGGPVFNEDGELVGLVSFGWFGQSNIQGLVTRHSIEQVMRRLEAVPLQQ